MDIITKVKALNFPPDQFVVMGSAILEMKGIRKAGDLDLIVTKELFEKLKTDPQWEYKQKVGTVGGVEFEELDNNQGVELYHTIYAGGGIENFLGNPDNIEVIDGIYFGSLANLLRVKGKSWDREKDHNDAELIKAYLAQDRKVDIHKAAGVLILDRKFLITRSKGKDFFIAPGGKVESGESVTEALIRELNEELSITVADADVTSFGTFFASAAGQSDMQLQMDVFLIERWSGEIAPTSEIDEVMWINSSLSTDIKLGSIFQHNVLPLLKEKNLID